MMCASGHVHGSRNDAVACDDRLCKVESHPGRATAALEGWAGALKRIADLELQVEEMRQALAAMVTHPKLYPNAGDWRIAQAQKALGDQTDKPKCSHEYSYRTSLQARQCELCGDVEGVVKRDKHAKTCDIADPATQALGCTCGLTQKRNQGGAK